MLFGKKPPAEDDPRLIEALGTVVDPELREPLTDLGMVGHARLDGKTARILLLQGSPGSPTRAGLTEAIGKAVHEAIPGTRTEIQWGLDIRNGRFGGGGAVESLPGTDDVANVILVASGKGGVGKSTVASNLALALSRLGARVGLMDADIYGPSVPTMLGANNDVTSADGKTIDPLEAHGIKLMSMGFFLGPDKAMIWRGPMLTSAVRQFLRDVAWGQLDYLVVDLPPGTGDVQLTFAQALKVTGAVVVSTPQDVALADVIRAKTMFDTVNIPILGLVENMSYFVCDGCDKKHYIFAHGGAQEAARRMQLDFLGEIPLVPAVREGGDRGIPIVQAEPDSPVARAFVQLARDVGSKARVVGAVGARAEAAKGPSNAGRARLPIVN
jgi:ATP-binding protein involved in chromosome partitioning